MNHNPWIILLALFLLIPLCLLPVLLKRYRAIQKIRSLSGEQKKQLLDDLLLPFGYRYLSDLDAISTRNDAWQRKTGYSSLYDKAAKHFNMVFHTIPIYFYYQNRTWLIQFWKGQYGINTGAEVGIYYTDKIVPPKDLSSTHFQVVSDQDRLPISYTLVRDGKPIARRFDITWWLTVFFVGLFSNPRQLSMEIVISFPNPKMQMSFLQALQDMKYPGYLYFSQKNNVCIRFAEMCPVLKDSKSNRLHQFHIGLVQFNNKVFCKLYLRITRPFHSTMDRILFFYKLLPFFFRKMLKHLKDIC